MTEQQTPATEDAAPLPKCPKCGGDMWDNRVGKRNPKAPDFKCKDRECDGVIWPPRDATLATTPTAAGAAPQAAAGGMPSCPICGGAMWDDRLSKRNPKAPDFKCKNKPKMKGGPGCEGVIWPPRAGAPSPYPPPVPRSGERGNMSAPPFDDTPPPNEPPPYDDAPRHDDDDLPF
jgi:transposase-like protein